MMKIYEYPDAKQVLVCGDIHGDFRFVVYKLCVQYACKDTLLIVAGDCGFGFEKPGFYDTVYNQVAGRLGKANNWVVFIRGNHDDPSYFAKEKVSYKRWRCIPDYSIVQACGHNILCVGGATSIDRHERKEENARLQGRGHLQTAVWWPDEAPVFAPELIESIPADIRIDTVATHTAPSFCELQSKQGLKSWAVMDPSLVWDTDRERKTLDEIFQCLRQYGHPVSRWYYGHFHQSWSGQREGVLFSMLNIEELKEIPAVVSKTAAFNPDETISLNGRNGKSTFLRHIGGKKYELYGDLEYMSIHFDADNSICAVDPPGGPFLYVGGKVADKTIKGIHSEGDSYYFELV